MAIPMISDKLSGSNNRGGVSKLDDAMIIALSDLIAKGNYYHDACAIVGIAEPTFYKWINQAQADEANGLSPQNSIHVRFVKSVQKARAQNRADFVAVIKETATVKRDWLSAMTFLERTDPEHWGRKDRTVSGNTYNINVEKAIITAGEKFDQALARLEQTKELASSTSDVQPKEDSDAVE